MFKKISNSWQLFKASLDVLQQDRELLWFPVLSTLAAILVGITFLVPLGFFVAGNPELSGEEGLPTFFYVGLFVFYVVQYFVMFFFNTALVGAALERLDGRDPTVRDGLRIAQERVVAIFGYALVASTVGIILQAIEERVGVVGRVIVGLLGATWTVASFLVVPVLATRNIGPIEAVSESISLLKKSWGENLAGHIGFGVIFALMYLALFGLFFLIGAPLMGTAGNSGAMAPALVVLAVFAIIVLVLVAIIQSALKGIYSAALYRYATAHTATPGFSEAVLDSAFKKKE